MLTRRDLFRGIAAASVLAAVPALAKPGYPVIHVDGIHDDADAINAWLRGEPVIINGNLSQLRDGEPAVFPSGSYLIGDTIRIDRPIVWSHSVVRLMGGSLHFAAPRVGV